MRILPDNAHTFLVPDKRKKPQPLNTLMVYMQTDTNCVQNAVSGEKRPQDFLK